MFIMPNLNISNKDITTRDVIQKGKISLAYIPTSDNPADIMTKPLLTPTAHVPHFLRLMIFLPSSGDPEIDEVPRISGDS